MCMEQQVPRLVGKVRFRLGKSGGEVIGQNSSRMEGVSSLDEGSMLLTRTKTITPGLDDDCARSTRPNRTYSRSPAHVAKRHRL
jgi:hypothetical protein